MHTGTQFILDQSYCVPFLGHIFQSSLYRLTLVVYSSRVCQTDSLWSSILGKSIIRNQLEQTTEVYFGCVYQTDFLCKSVLFKYISLLCSWILVRSLQRDLFHRSIYQSSLLYLETERDLLRLSIFRTYILALQVYFSRVELNWTQ